MVKVSMSDKDFNTSNYFEEGVHEVTIQGATLDALPDGREYIEVGVTGEGEDSVRLFLSTEKAIKYHLRTLQAICVHNAKSDTAKDKVRSAFVGEIDDAKLRKILGEMDGYKAWFSVYKSDRTYTGTDGNTYNSFDKNLYGYEPQPKVASREDQIKDLMGAGTQSVDTDDVPFA